MGPPRCRCVWVWCYVLSLSVLTRSLELHDLFEFGEEARDQQLRPGSDSTAKLLLNSSVWFFGQSLDKVYINTNGLVAAAEPPAEGGYLGKTPAAFSVMAALMGDLDTSDGQGAVFFREDAAPHVLRRAAEHIGRAFPSDTGVDPSSVLVVTWENMAAHGMLGRGDGLGTQRNTFQLVVASTTSASFAILLYPRGALQFISTSIDGGSKLLEAGFNQGLVQHWLWGSTQGKHFPTTTKEEASVRELTEKTNSGRRGVWVYNISGTHIIEGLVPMDASTTELATEPTTSIQLAPTTEAVPEENEDFSTETPPEYQPRYPEAEIITPEYNEPGPEEPDLVESDLFEAGNPETEADPPTQRYPTQPERRRQDQSETTAPTRAVPETTVPLYSPVGSTHPEQMETTEPTEPLQPTYTVPESSEPRFPSVDPRSDPDMVQSQYINPDSAQPQIVTVDEDEDLDFDMFSYSLETCALNHHRCSAFADCRDHSSGYCCHCRPGYYGNGKDCVAEGKPQRMNGKVSGRIFVGDSPIELHNKDLHSYVVANDGRAYVAISSIPPSLGPSLLPLSSLGGIIGWAFALEQPGYQNGFSLVGGVFARQTEVTFQPGDERLSIKQQFNGIDEHDHLVVSTELEGRVPVVPLGSTVQINPYKEIYQYDRNLVTSSSNRNYTITSPHGLVQSRSYQWRQTITFQSCPHDDASRAAVPTQQLSVDQIFVMFDPDNLLIRYAMSNKIGSIHSSLSELNPCFTGRHGCDINAVCRPGDGLHFFCQCAAGFTGDGRYCHDTDECKEDPPACGANAVCSNQPGTFRCECAAGFVFASDGRTCTEEHRPVNHCQTGSHDCDATDRALCSYRGGSVYVCSCLPGYVGDGRVCRDADECQQDPCHRDARCSNTHGSYTCQCHPGFHGDGFQCSPTSTERDKSLCQRHRDQASSTGLLSFFRPRPSVGHYVPQCDEHGAYEPTQCHSSLGQCWCVDANGQEVPNTRTGPGNTPLCINQAVTPPAVGPTPRPNVQPVAPGTHLIFAQSGRIEHVPLDGYRMKKEEAKPLLHVPDQVVIAVAYDCVEKTVYWTDITGPGISKARLSGGDISPVITKELQSPEGIAVDHVARLLFWTDSMRDTVEVSKLDGSQRRVLFDTDLVNPRPIVTNPTYGRLYWADWNRDDPKIEMSNMDGTERTVLVKDDLGLPNGLTFDLDNQLLCWADAGTRKLECMDPHRRIRRQVADGIQYPFALVSYGKNLYYTDWRREAIVAVDRRSEKETEDFLPQRRSRVYGITTTMTQCPRVYNYCSNNGGCSHLCLPRLGGFTCRCPDTSDAQCVETNP